MMFGINSAAATTTLSKGDIGVRNTQAIGELGRSYDGSFQALLDAGLDQQAVDHDFDGVVLAPVEGDILVE